MRKRTPASQKLKGYQGKRLVNSYPSGGDGATGKLTSEPFQIERRFINFLIGGGNHMRPDGVVDAGINLIVDGKIVRNATGANSDTMSLSSWDVSELEGRTGVLEILDNATGSWGHIDIDQIRIRRPLPAGHRFGGRPTGCRLACLGRAGFHREGPREPFLSANPEQACFEPASDAKEVERGSGTEEGKNCTGSVVRPFQTRSRRVTRDHLRARRGIFRI
jgi:hypothetical protein